MAPTFATTLLGILLSRSMFLVGLLSGLLFGAIPSMATPVQHKSDASVTVHPFGHTKNGDEISQFVLTNKHGVTARVITYGATLTELSVPDRTGKFDNVVLGFDSLAPYETVSPYFGATIGRCANRIAGAEFELNGKKYKLAANNDKNTLHGGTIGFNKKVWQARIVENSKDAAVEFSLVSADGDEGFPGNIEVSLRYALTEDNKLDLQYSASVDKACPVNLTNHAYFNLSGAGNPSILKHALTLNAQVYTPVNNELIPTGELLNVQGSPMDFTTPKEIGKEIEKVNGGYDHNFVLSPDLLQADGTRQAARLVDASTGRVLVMYTTEPGVQFYSGNFLDGTIRGNGGVYPKHSALCLEAQHFPDAVHHKNFPSIILEPGAKYAQHTIYAFSTEEQ